MTYKITNKMESLMLDILIIKQIVSNKSKEEVKDSEVESYSKGLEKTRNEFVSKLNVLGIKYTKIDDAYQICFNYIIELIGRDADFNFFKNVLGFTEADYQACLKK